MAKNQATEGQASIGEAAAPTKLTSIDRAKATRSGVGYAETLTAQAATDFGKGTPAYKRALAEAIVQLRASAAE